MSQAIIAVTSPIPDASPHLAGNRANADFIAHLAATRAQAPQTRVRRRVEPGEAAAAYGALRRLPGPVGRTISRSL